MKAKESFQKGPHREALEKWTQTSAAEAARDAALLHFVEQQPTNVSDPTKGWYAHSQLAGARQIMDILFSLHLKEENRKTDPLPKLRSPE